MENNDYDDYLRMLQGEDEEERDNNRLYEKFGEQELDSEYEPSDSEELNLGRNKRKSALSFNQAAKRAAPIQQTDSDSCTSESTSESATSREIVFLGRNKRKSALSSNQAAKRAAPAQETDSDSCTSASASTTESATSAKTANGEGYGQPKKRLSKAEIEQRNALIDLKIIDGTMVAKKRTATSWSNVWSNFEEIYENDQRDPHFVRCVKCKLIIHKPSSNTNVLLRHQCDMDVENMRLNVDTEIKQKLKVAAANFVIKDLRPFAAIEGEGLLDLCMACVLFGKTYRKSVQLDLTRALPSRNTVKSTVKEIATATRTRISLMIKQAINTGGIAAAVDCWQDDYRKIPYMGIVAYLTIHENKKIERHRFILSTREVTEFIKTGKILTDLILDVFMDFELPNDDVKKHVIFLSDRGADIKYGLLNNGFQRLTCYAHIIHNLVSEMLKDPNVTSIIERCAALSSYVKNSGLNKHLNPSLKRFTKTRWNSVFIMMDCIIKSYNEVYELIQAKQRLRNEARLLQSRSAGDQAITSLVTDINQAELMDICAFLQPFKVMTDEIEGDKYMTLHLVWTKYLDLNKLLKETDVENMEEVDGKITLVNAMKKLGRQHSPANY